MPTTHTPRTALSTLDLLITITATVALLAALTPALHVSIGPVTLSVTTPARPALLTALLLTLRVALTRRHRDDTPAPTLTRSIFIAFIAASAGYWLLYLTTTCGGADSYGYVSAALHLRSGTLAIPQPDAQWLPAHDALGILTPLGYLPRPASGDIVPQYPLGFPALIAAATLLLPFEVTPYLIAPATALAAIALVFLIARTWTRDAQTAWLAAAIAAWDPLLVTYAKQPMSDVPAAAWLLLSVWLLVRASPRPFAAGLAAGASFLTRPGGIGAIASVVLLAVWPPSHARTSLPRFAAGLLPALAGQALLQWQLFGSPWQTGYGSLAALYGGATLLDNAAIYSRALVTTHAVSWIPLAVVGVASLRPRRAAAWIGVALVASLGPYLLYFRFDHWETLRFILPAVLLVNIGVAAGAARVAAAYGTATARALVLVVVAGLTCAHAGTFLARQGVPSLMENERRYLRTADWLARFTAPAALVVAGQHSGSIRHYADRMTLRWDAIAADDLSPVVREARRRGRPVYAALEGNELARFRERFRDALAGQGGVSMLPGAQIRDVQIWELSPQEPWP